MSCGNLGDGQRFLLRSPLASTPTHVDVRNCKIDWPMNPSATSLHDQGVSQEGSHAADSLVSGLSFMLLANLLQRGIGFIRNLCFCVFLTQDHLGLWALASSFFVLAAPLSVLGLPGTFGRFVETYRSNGSLGLFLNRIASVCALGTLTMATLLTLCPEVCSRMVFGCSLTSGTMFLVSMTLVSVIVFNAITELVGGLRRPQIVSAMHTTNSLTFTGVSLAGLYCYNDWRVLLLAFCIASLVGLIPAVRRWHTLGMDSHGHGSPRALPVWSRIVPYALSIWCMNLLTNLFDVADRYMLLYFVSASAGDGQAVVGQYHSGRIMPVLLSSLAMMLTGMLLPYLAAEWEAKDRAGLLRTLRITFKGALFFFFTLSLGSIVIAPWVFNGLLGGRYADGLAVMPLALMHCCWMGQATLMHNYFWCAERGRIVGLLMGIGLLLNIALNFVWVPHFGLMGAMAATCVAGAAILAMTLRMLARDGMSLGGNCWLLTLLPITLLLGPVVACVGWVLAILVASRTRYLFSLAEKELLESAIRPLLVRLGFHTLSIWPKSTLTAGN